MDPMTWFPQRAQEHQLPITGMVLGPMYDRLLAALKEGIPHLPDLDSDISVLAVVLGLGRGRRVRCTLGAEGRKLILISCCWF